MYILIIAGGREYKFKQRDRNALTGLIHRLGGKKNVIIRTGGASGADTEGYLWAYDNSIPREPPTLADWKAWDHPDACPKEGKFGLYDACAGFRRNSLMAVGNPDDPLMPKANGVVLFPGGAGTNDMWQKAKAAELEIFDWRVKA